MSKRQDEARDRVWEEFKYWQTKYGCVDPFECLIAAVLTAAALREFADE